MRPWASCWQVRIIVEHALYQQALAGVHELDAKQGRASDAVSEQLAASLAVLARQQGCSASSTWC
ncbi:MAG TPA: XVIPCD domain-containing protein [Pseudoxanthomonas sp.]|nr:XVIPCD domain-containing protein [Pseudoxanthomonas sp.]